MFKQYKDYQNSKDIKARYLILIAFSLNSISLFPEGQKFPGQLEPRYPEIIPRSMDLRPRIEDEEWRNIGFKRRKPLYIFTSDLQKVKTSPPKIIIVTPSD